MLAVIRRRCYLLRMASGDDHARLIRDVVPAGGSGRETLLALVSHLLDAGVPADALTPMIGRLGDLTDAEVRACRGVGRAGRPEAAIKEKMALTVCAATVTALNERTQCGVSEALKRVAGVSGINRQTLKSARENLGRHTRRPGSKEIVGVKSKFQTDAHEEYLNELRAMPDDQFEAEALRRIEGLGVFVRTKSPRPIC